MMNRMIMYGVEFQFDWRIYPDSIHLKFWPVEEPGLAAYYNSSSINSQELWKFVRESSHETVEAIRTKLPPKIQPGVDHVSDGYKHINMLIELTENLQQRVRRLEKKEGDAT